ncbi:hypothetical protein AB0M54_16780 [Actinoplanes sp. NPDC051470]|uniref:hypothetical protein n=1 Tax=Actinoplanes sp. NPDC051470 TaxID=3157224 RepID=UPI00342EF8EA
MLTRGWLAAAVVLTLAVAAAPTPAAAEPSLAWPGRPICAEGSVGPGERTDTDPARTPITFSVQACAGEDAAAVAAGRWAIAVYSTHRSRVAGDGRARMRSHGDPWVGQTFGWEDDGLRLDSGVIQAACLITGHTVRVACVRLDAIGDAGTIVMEPLAVTDPVVSRFAVIVPPSAYTKPECGACV